MKVSENLFNELETPGASVRQSAAPVAEPTAESAEARVEAAVAASPAVAEKIASVTADIAAKVAKVRESNAAEQAENVASTIHKKDVAKMVPEAMSIEMQAYANSAIKAAISEVLAQVLPPIISELKKPSEKDRIAMEEHEAFMSRMKREKKQGLEQDKQNRANLKAQQDGCTHLDKNNNESIALSHNYPDRLPRGICVQCRLLIEPKHYELAVPGLDTLAQGEAFCRELEKYGVRGVTPFVNPKTGICTHLLYPEHPLYARVRRLEAMQG